LQTTVRHLLLAMAVQVLLSYDTQSN